MRGCAMRFIILDLVCKVHVQAILTRNTVCNTKTSAGDTKRNVSTDEQVYLRKNLTHNHTVCAG